MNEVELKINDTNENRNYIIADKIDEFEKNE